MNCDPSLSKGLIGSKLYFNNFLANLVCVMLIFCEWIFNSEIGLYELCRDWPSLLFVLVTKWLGVMLGPKETLFVSS